MKTVNATHQANMMSTDPVVQAKQSIFTNIEPQSGITKQHYNIKSRIKMDGIRTGTGSFLPNKKDFQE